MSLETAIDDLSGLPEPGFLSALSKIPRVLGGVLIIVGISWVTGIKHHSTDDAVKIGKDVSRCVGIAAGGSTFTFNPKCPDHGEFPAIVKDLLAR